MFCLPNTGREVEAERDRLGAEAGKGVIMGRFEVVRREG